MQIFHPIAELVEDFCLNGALKESQKERIVHCCHGCNVASNELSMLLYPRVTQLKCILHSEFSPCVLLRVGPSIRKCDYNHN